MAGQRGRAIVRAAMKNDRVGSFLPAGAAAMLIVSAALLVACGPGDPEPEPPVASVGDDFTVPWGQTVVLEGSCDHSSAAARSQLTYRWDMIDWPADSGLTPDDIQEREGIDAFFHPDASGPYSFTFRCAVGEMATAELVSAEVRITATVEARPPNRDPIVDAGEDLVAEVGDTVLLVADASDPDGDPLTFTWSLIGRPQGTDLDSSDIVAADTAEARFVPDVAGDWSFRVRVQDGRGGEATDEIEVTAIEVVRIDGSLTVTVVDQETAAPIAGATVSAAGLSGETGADGRVTLSDDALEGPLDIAVTVPGTVDWNHDGDPATSAITVPRYRDTILTGIDRPEATVLVEPTVRTRETAAHGVVRGAIPESLFEKLPEVERMFSIAGATMSGQLRMVLVAPVLPRSSLVDLEVPDFLVPSPTPGVPLPGNMGSDDAFLNEFADQFGRDTSVDLPFAHFELGAPAGTQRFYVLGGIATLDILRLLSLLVYGAQEGAIGSETASVLGAIDFTTLYMGLLEVSVPAGGEVDISAHLVDTADWIAFQEVPYASARQVEEVCDDSGFCEELNRVRLFPSSTVTLVPEPPPADPRVAAAMPATSPYELFCDGAGGVAPCDPPNVIDLAVPQDAGTDVPYGLDLAVLELPVGHALAPEGGMALVGFRFSRAPGLESAQNVFAVPPVDGPFSGLTYSGVSLAFRRLLTREGDGSYRYQVGRAVDSLSRLLPGATAEVDPDRPFPWLATDPDGLEVEVLFKTEDVVSDPPTVVLAHGLATGLVEADANRTLPAELPLVVEDSVDLVVVTFSATDRSVAAGDRVPALIPRVSVLLPAGTDTVPVPADLSDRFDTGDEVHVEVTGYRIRGSFAYQQPHDPRLVQRRRSLASDAWTFRMP
jgi:hypothetical protein